MPSRLPTLTVCVLLALPLYAPPALHADFVRGDANRDGRLSLTDAIATATALFSGGAALTCEDAADANDDGQLDLTDTLATLRFLFADGELPYPQHRQEGTWQEGPDVTCDALGCADAHRVTPAIVINEIHYHPNEVLNQDLEFVELHNRSSIDIDVSGYEFTAGIRMTIPDGTVIPAHGFLLVLKDLEARFFRSRPGGKVGPFEGRLADGGERLTLQDGECVIETLSYDDRRPWPVGPDGYKPTLERSSPWTSAADPHSWRSSLERGGQLGGTPGEENTTVGTPTHPLLESFSVDPEHPTSEDAVRVRITLDLPAARLRGVTLRFERVGAAVGAPDSVPMELESSSASTSRFMATLPPGPSQTMVRCNAEVELAEGTSVILPHPGDEAPVLSYFTYDGEIRSRFPVMWALPGRFSGIVPRDGIKIGGVAIQEVGEGFAVEYDGADVHRRATHNSPNNGINVTFLKGKEFRGEKTLNMPLELGPQNPQGAQPEHFSHFVFRQLGALAPDATWYRVIDYSQPEDDGRHGQRLAVQQVNGRFFELNDIDPNGDLYKFERFGFLQRTNLAAGPQNRLDLFAALVDGRVREVFDLEKVLLYSAVSVLIGNWDGFGGNNMFLYFDQFGTGRWMFIPWDLDSVFNCYELSVAYPLDGQNGGGCPPRNPLVTDIFHQDSELDQLYREAVRRFVAPGGAFTSETLEPQIQEFETLLLEDLALHEEFIGAERTERRAGILTTYERIRDFVARRVEFLRGELSADE